MSDLAAKIKDARGTLRPVEWSTARAEAVRRRIHSKERRFALSTVALGSAALAVAVAVAIVWFAQSATSGLAPELATVDRPEIRPSAQIELENGTRAVQLGSGSRVRLVRETDEVVSFALKSGKGWFEVTPSEKRRVEVQIEDVHVEVMGTEFVVEITGEVVHVWVQRGKVVVTSKGQTTTVITGEHREFPAHDKVRDSKVVADDAVPPSKEEPVLVPSPPTPKRDSTHRNDTPQPDKTKRNKTDPVEPAKTEEVEPEPEPEPEPVVVVKAVPKVDRVSLLWKRADGARMSGDKAEAISALTELLGKHDDDPRAALAAFTLGRVLVDANRSPVVAARAFAKARKLAPAGPLVEDALLREIEAWYEAGDSRRVQKRSEKYMKLFPKGRYVKQVRDLIENP